MPSCDWRASGSHYACDGTVKALLSQYQETISISIYNKTIVAAGDSLFLPFANFSQPDSESAFSICEKSDQKISFDNYGCDFDKNIMTSMTVLSGTFNPILALLQIEKRRKYTSEGARNLIADGTYFDKTTAYAIGTYKCRPVKNRQ